ncbi:fructuronate reductase [Pseudonocardia ammonioxydans]|uniref:Mannitol-1-phosphate 5-dehydrogenase n=1 Tax=Pseudonocardia ammonioxydans TaxID=260086 RepID=A0A1I5H2K3_PSUAM|nr:mannitol dehydrogenase family protein [Pseudonocardia ammonioxydans]SFO42437.1 fructuronate reductase [Pseudonocardia ammonioxydans]
MTTESVQHSATPQHTATQHTAAHRPRRGARPAAPTGIVHIGLGNFFRAHLAWYTEHAPDRGDWGIAAFGGRGAGLARTLRAQDGLYTLVTRHPGGPVSETVASLSACHGGAEHARLLDLVADPRTRVVTLTVTEAGYRRGPGGGLDHTDPEVAADLAALGRSRRAPVTTVPARLVAGLAARHDAGSGACTVLSCDNLDGNGAVTRRVVREAAAAVDPGLASWIEDTVAFPSAMVDRITPRTGAGEIAKVLLPSGTADRAPVTTEPFSEWVLQDDFPAGRPRWEDAGARFVPDVTAHERRKLLMLNGAHSLLAYAAPLRGHTTVAEAVADPVVRGWTDGWWDAAQRHVPLAGADLARYRAELAARFANTGIRHRLAQIAADGSQKLPVRVLPVLRAERDAGRLGPAVTRPLAAWLLSLRGGPPDDPLGTDPLGTDPLGTDPLADDPLADDLAAAAAGAPADAARRVLRLLDPDLAGDEDVVTAVAAEAAALSAGG